MTLSVFYDHIVNASKQTGKPLPEVLSLVKDNGIQAVELDLFHLSDSIDHLALIKNAGLHIGCVNSFYRMEEEFDEQQAASHIDSAIACGCDTILVVPGFLSLEEGNALAAVILSKEATGNYLNQCGRALRIAEGLARITKMASEKNVQVTVEDFDNITSPLSGLNSLLWFLERIPDLKCTFDTGNFVTHGDDLFEAWSLLKHRVIHVHCKDRSDGPAAIGDGYLPIRQILAEMERSGYAGNVAIEHYGAIDQLDYIQRSAGYLAFLSQ